MAKTQISDELSNVDQLTTLAAPPYGDKSQRPIWLQIYDRLAEACSGQLIEPGSRLPGEYKMATIFGVNRMTMRNALIRLQREGFLQARKGVGIFVRPPTQRYVVEDNMRFGGALEAGGVVTTETLSLRRRKASPQAREAYGLSARGQTIELRRLRSLDGAAIYYAVKEFLPEMFPRFEEVYAASGSVAQVYRDHGVKDYKRLETRVLGAFASREEAEVLQLTPKTPVLHVNAKNADPSGRLIEFNRGCWPLTSVELVFPSR